MIYLKLYLEFFKIGLFTIGGGLATLPFLQEIVSKYGWITSEELLNMIAISESTPGPIGINMATFVGYKTTGVFGGILATIGIVTPSLVIIIIIAHYFAKFNEKPIVQSSFYGIRPAVAGIIGAAGFQVAKISIFNLNRFIESKRMLDIIDFKAMILFVFMMFAINRFKKHPIIYIILAGFIGVIFKY